MSGKVKLAVVSTHGHAPYALVPHLCPVSGQAGRPECVTHDPWSGRPSLCPFLLGVRVYVGATSDDSRTAAEIQDWLATHSQDGTREYWAICLRRESKVTLPGARAHFWE